MAAAKALQNPFEKKDEEKPEKGEEKAAAREDDVEVKLDDDEDDEDEGGEESPSKPSWKEKKRNRYAERIREAEEAKREAEQARQEIAQLRQQQNQIVQAIQPQRGEGPQQQLQRLREYKQSKIEEFNGLVAKGAAPELLKNYYAEAERIQDAEIDLVLQIREANDPRNDPAYQHNQQIISWLQSSHSDVMSHPRRDDIILAARGKLMQLIGQGKARMGDFESYTRALNETKADFGLVRRPANSSNGMQAKLAGVPRGGGSGEAPRTMRLSKEEQKMAEARYHRIAKSPEEAHRMWAKDIAKQREKKARAGE